MKLESEILTPALLWGEGLKLKDRIGSPALSTNSEK